MFGYDRSEVVGRHVVMLVPSRFVHHRDYNRAYFRNPERVRMGQGREGYALRKDGSEFPAEISLSPLETLEKRIVSAAVRDITDL
jgi:PAS domain S-box-containing protein